VYSTKKLHALFCVTFGSICLPVGPAMCNMLFVKYAGKTHEIYHNHTDQAVKLSSLRPMTSLTSTNQSINQSINTFITRHGTEERATVRIMPKQREMS